MDFIKLKSFHKATDTVNRTKEQPGEWGKIFTNSACNGGLISKLCKELKKLYIKITDNPVFKLMNRAKHRILYRGITNG